MNLCKSISRRITPFILISLGFVQITSCSSDDSSFAPGSATAFALAFLLDIPEFFAWKDGDGSWKEIPASSLAANIKLDVSDTDGRYSYVAYGNYRGGSRAYYVESTLDDAVEHRLVFDDTNDTTDYIIDVSAANFDTGRFWTGTDYKSFANLKSFNTSTPSFTYTLTQDNDDPVAGDTLLILDNAGSGHIKLEAVDFTSTPSINYTATVTDVGTPFIVDQPTISADPEYQGLSFKLSGLNLKAQLVQDTGAGNASVSLEKYSVPSDRIYSLSAKWLAPKASTGAAYDADYKYSEYSNDPQDTTIDTRPAVAPDVTVGSDSNYSVRFDYSSQYSSGIPGLKNVVRGAKVGEWSIKQTMGRYQPSGAQSFGLDASLFGMFPYLAGKEPGTGDVTRVSFYESNRDAEKELDYQYSSHEASADDDLMVRHRLNLKF